MPSPPSDLPIESALPDLRRALADAGMAVLQAPPGAGKTTRVPLALLDEGWLGGRRIVMLEPRRLATRAAARRMAATLGEEVGATVGYRMRLDSRVGPATRIEVVTEGVLTRMLQDDPALEGVGLLAFDEFHERSLNADLGLALALECRRALRDDLRLLVMSATLDGGLVAALLGGAPVVASEGRAWPVSTRWLPRAANDRIEAAVAAAVRRALAEEDGDILAFLPGEAEIRRTAAALDGLPDTVILAPLYGNLPQAEQDQAIRPAPPGRRKVVLATSIAETSLTIEGVRVVVDGGLMRVPRFEPRSGMTRLVTVRVSKASAEQRQGRAGRLGPGVCYRLWAEAEHRALAAFNTPEIIEADLAPLALELAAWGSEPSALSWLDPPPQGAFAQARELLGSLGAIEGGGRLTAHGRAMAALGLHPRLAHMALEGRDMGLGRLACEIAALLEERDILRAGPGERDSDLRTRVEALRAPAGRRGADPGAVRRVLETARHWQRRLGIAAGADDNVEATGLLLAFAYPDRVAQRRPGGERQYRLSNGRGAFFAQPEALSASDWLAIAELDGDRREARIFLAAPLRQAEIEEHFADLIRTVESVGWSGRDEAVLARRQRCLGALVLADEPAAAAPEAVTAALMQGIREMGLAALPWTPDLLRFRDRVAFMRRLEGDEWPDLSDAALLAGLESWLAPYAAGMSRRAHLAKLDLAAALRAQLSWEQSRRLDTLAPTHVVVPSGSRLLIDYSGEEPVLAVRLQEMFGLAETPAIADGRVPLLLHLLSPAHRPMQVTRDLAGFWASGYKAVRSDLRGRYPKHHWPEDPLQAVPTSRAKPRAR